MKLPDVFINRIHASALGKSVVRVQASPLHTLSPGPVKVSCEAALMHYWKL